MAFLAPAAVAAGALGALGLLGAGVGVGVAVAKANSDLVRAEKFAWAKEHNLLVDAFTRDDLQTMVRAAFRPGRELQLCVQYFRDVYGLVLYEHWFVTSGDWIIEFGNGEGLTGHTVCLHNNPRSGYHVRKTYPITEDMIERMVRVVGATNYSLLLRNCEHVANYIAEDRWVSLQTLEGGNIGQALIEYVPDRSIKALRNTPPQELRPEAPADSTRPIYPEAERERVRYSRQDPFLDAGDRSAYNVAVLGVTGAGKSTVINLLFNRRVCPCSDDLDSVTRSMEFHVGQGETPGGAEQRINIIDSVGFCDSHLDPVDVARIIKESIKGNCMRLHKVLVVHSGRLQKDQEDSIKQILQWLKYDQTAGSGPSFSVSFIYTKADGKTESEKAKLVEKLCDRLGARSGAFRLGRDGPVYTNAFAVSFPPGAPFEQVREDREKLMRQVFDISTIPIQVERSMCTIL